MSGVMSLEQSNIIRDSDDQRIKSLFDSLWQDYLARLCPSATQVHQLLRKHEGSIELINDHIALRTFSGSKLGLPQLAKHFESLGYTKGGEYEFKEKKLFAHHYQHSNLKFPKVFISELLLEQCSLPLQECVKKLVDQVDDSYTNHASFLHSGRPWQLNLDEYQILVRESEYAAWVAAHGFGANHFTVYVNELRQFTTLEQVNLLLKDHGFSLNQGGGEVKGSIHERLEQSATIADQVEVQFGDDIRSIAGGFYEFAKRYPINLKEKSNSPLLYQGFVAASADKIFESTDSN